VALIGFAVIAFLISIDLPGMRGFAFGPGTAPRLFAGVLATLGLIVAITGLFTDGPEGQRFTLRGTLVVGGALAAWFAMVWLFGQFTAHYAQPLATLVLAVVAFAGMHVLDNVGVRGPFMITLSIFAFAMFIRPLGLVIASFLTILLCAAAADDLQMHKGRATALILLPIITFPVFVYIWPFGETVSVWPFGNIALREIIAAALSFAICFGASPDARWRETIIIAGALTLFCSILFPWGLNLPFQLWPRFS
jgi:putative tricarboxylic transport membrane protein